MSDTPYIPKARLGRTLGDALKKATKPAFKKRSQMEHRLFTEWGDIVGAELAGKTLPEKLIKRQDGLYLQLRVHPAFALILQHQEPQILERIGQFFGYNTISQIKLRHDATLSMQGSASAIPLASPLSPPKPAAPPLPERTEEALGAMESDTLSDALRDLARHIRAD